MGKRLERIYHVRNKNFPSVTEELKQRDKATTVYDKEIQRYM